MNKLGVLFNNLGPSDINLYLLSCINRATKEKQANFIGFYETPVRPMTIYPFPIFNLVDVYSFNNPVIATSVENGIKLLDIFGPTRKILYLHNLDWVNWQNWASETLFNLFNNIEVYTRSQLYADIIKNNFNKDCKLVEFNKLFESILEKAA